MVRGIELGSLVDAGFYYSPQFLCHYHGDNKSGPYAGDLIIDIGKVFQIVWPLHK